MDGAHGIQGWTMSDLLDWLQLALLPISRKQKQALLHISGAPTALFGIAETALPVQHHFPELQRLIASQNDLLPRAKELKHQVEELGWQILTPSHQGFPQQLKQIPDPPLILYIKGDLKALDEPQIAIVGSRKATPLGRKLAQRFAKHLSDWGVGVVSGLARGVDASAHEGALLGNTATSAVLANGPGPIYPRANQRIADQILCSGGLLLTENPPGTQLEPWRFPERNRLVSGLALGTLVVEADLKSGSLITASLALSQGREVFAIPGAISNMQARGCHQLIKQGAMLVESPEDILNSLHKELRNICPVRAVSSHSPDTVQSPLLQTIGASALTLNELADVSGMELNRLQVELARLELRGAIFRHAGRYFRNA